MIIPEKGNRRFLYLPVCLPANGCLPRIGSSSLSVFSRKEYLFPRPVGHLGFRDSPFTAWQSDILRMLQKRLISPWYRIGIGAALLITARFRMQLPGEPLII